MAKRTTTFERMLPGYPGAAIAFEAVGAKISALRVDDEGMQLREPSLRGARLIYVTPARQFPLDITMSLRRRLELLRLLASPAR